MFGYFSFTLSNPICQDFISCSLNQFCKRSVTFSPAGAAAWPPLGFAAGAATGAQAANASAPRVTPERRKKSRRLWRNTLLWVCVVSMIVFFSFYLLGSNYEIHDVR